MITQVELDVLWDFDDPVASERRLWSAADSAPSPDREEYLTQVARSLGLQHRFTEARTLTAAERAAAAGFDFLRIDALHMLAIADSDPAGRWTEQATPTRRSSNSQPRAPGPNGSERHCSSVMRGEALAEARQAQEAAGS
ncbi:hypothetical protein [Microlunatus soli]|uniref:Uncharacterized protein n=1 Tax=Microlunatus soli TaxID=630515 RepID=A0A1H1Y2M9_9ACTN|nr:hypothetical protein [Microlunatus soli]SDT15661.1 hypothetical protein SAMN04489812_4362 [Microlunatus soli]